MEREQELDSGDNKCHFGHVVYDFYRMTRKSCLGRVVSMNQKFRGEVSARDREHIHLHVVLGVTRMEESI